MFPPTLSWLVRSNRTPRSANSLASCPWTIDAQLRNLRELVGVVLAGEDRVREVLSDLFGVDVEGGGELDVADVVAPQIHVHQAWDLLGGIGVLVVLDALHERARAVADAYDR